MVGVFSFLRPAPSGGEIKYSSPGWFSRDTWWARWIIRQHHHRRSKSTPREGEKTKQNWLPIRDRYFSVRQPVSTSKVTNWLTATFSHAPRPQSDGAGNIHPPEVAKCLASCYAPSHRITTTKNPPPVHVFPGGKIIVKFQFYFFFN